MVRNSSPDNERTESPPTDRVVAIVELLASQPEPSSTALIASRLELNRSTTTSILTALEGAGWVARRSDRRYTLGSGLIGVAEAVRKTFPLSDRFTDAMEGLAQRTGCGAALAFVSATELTFLEVIRGLGQIPGGVEIGFRLPLQAPAGVAVIAHRDPQVQRAWLDTAPTEYRPAIEDALAQVRGTGAAVFGLGESDPAVLDVLGEVAELLAEHPRRGALRRRVFGMLTGIGGSPYTAKQLGTSEPLSVSYLTAPVFDGERAVYELQLGPLRPAVGSDERAHYIDELITTAKALSEQ